MALALDALGPRSVPRGLLHVTARVLINGDDRLSFYRLDEDKQTAIQFSGGRTSGYLLHQIVRAHEGALPDNAKVLFQNTGREMPETLRFVERIGEELGVEIIWLEYDADEGWARVGPGTNRPASVNGEPFEAILSRYKWRMLPYWNAKFCTAELKVRPARDYLRWLGWSEWRSLIGLRADESARIAKMMARGAGGKDGPDMRDRRFPLADAGVTKRHVSAFWKRQPYNLDLPDNDGSTPLGNCDGCFLKSEKNRAHLARYYPERAAWWAEMEGRVSEGARQDARFDRRVSWANLIHHVERQPDWVFSAETDVYCDTAFGGCHE